LRRRGKKEDLNQGRREGDEEIEEDGEGM